MNFIFLGAGYCSKFVIPLLSNNFKIICTHNETIKEWVQDYKYNVERTTFKNFSTNFESYLKKKSFILNSIPPDRKGDIVINKLKQKLIDYKKNIEWYGYFSSTSVYGNHDGGWVEETTKLNPTSLRGLRRKQAEKDHIYLYENYKIPIHIFRLPGIYGSGRSVIDKFKKNKAVEIVKKDHFFSRIHVEDIATAIILSIRNKTPGEIFNVCDDMPSPSDEVVRFAAGLMNIKKIESKNFDDNVLNQRTKDFYLDNKRVKNKKIKKILGWTPKYRNYRLGLKKIFELPE